jgi:hypothetical protein
MEAPVRDSWLFLNGWKRLSSDELESLGGDWVSINELEVLCMHEDGGTCIGAGTRSGVHWT